MVKFSSAKATSALKSTLVLLGGIIGAKALKGIVEANFPQFAQYTNYGVLAASLIGVMVTEPIVQSVGKGAMLYAAVQLINQLMPAGANKYIPQISGVNGVNGVGNIPRLRAGQYRVIPRQSMQLGGHSFQAG